MTEPIKFEFMTRRYALMVMRLNPTTGEPMGKPMYATPGDVEAAQASLQQRPGAPLGYDDASEQERSEIIDATISQPIKQEKP